MAQIFLTEESVKSARWQEAFPRAETHALANAHWEEYLSNISFNAFDFCWLYQPSALNENIITSLVKKSVFVIVLTAAENSAQARRALELGASGYVHYLSPASLLQQAAQVIEQGGLWLGADLMRQLVLTTAVQLKASSQKSDLACLTERERGVADLVASGKTNKEIARDLAITERTVKAHLSAIFEKLQVRDRLQLVLKMSQV